ncbi:hypothetical protein [Microbacterium sp. APC 3901]|uniref:hypothetical protein n=1 Tax=Microbacterium sp. APC 3901 TaxID=3035192 RepID=UPI0025B594F3|nr:hypothetical protein [Microbacterium sp. APC 3901]MDN3445246.1 hypothetical protein [Microbacterium sp. APC 3901]
MSTMVVVNADIHQNRESTVLRLLALASTVFTALVIIVSILAGFFTTNLWGTLLFILWFLAWTALWWWLAARAAERAMERFMELTSMPCSQCGAPGTMGYRVCKNCGRVKQSGI